MTRSRQIAREESGTSKAIVVLICLVPMIATIVYGAVDSWMLGLLSILVTIIALLWLTDAGLTGELEYSSNLMQLPLLAIIAIACVQLLPLASPSNSGQETSLVTRSISMDAYATRFFLIRLMISFVFFAAALVYIRGLDRRKAVAVLIVVFGALIAFFGILQRLATPEAVIYGIRETPQAVPFGPFVNQHHFAALMEMTSGIALGLLFGSGFARDRKLFVVIAAVIMGMAIILTSSRGGMISYLGVIAFASVASLVRRGAGRRAQTLDMQTDTRRNLFVATATVALFIIVLGSVLFVGGEASLLRGIGVTEMPTEVTNGRAHFWNVAWQIFLAHPILGAGYDAFGVAFTRYDTWNGQFRVEQAHNDYLQTLADGGIVSFVVVVAFIGLLFKKGISAIVGGSRDIDRSISTGALAGCFGILIHSFFDFPLRTPANAFFFLLLVVLAVERSSRARTADTATVPLSPHPSFRKARRTSPDTSRASRSTT